MRRTCLYTRAHAGRKSVITTFKVKTMSSLADAVTEEALGFSPRRGEAQNHTTAALRFG